jgi:hypothetical protein
MPVLRAVMTVVAVLALGGALVGLACGAPLPAILWAAGIGTVLVAGVLFERAHYKHLRSATPGAGWIATEERFVDPETGQLVQVHVRPDTGERAYVVVGLPPGGNPAA